MKFIVRITLVLLFSTNLLNSSELNRLEEEIKKMYSNISPSIVSVHYGSKTDPDFTGTGVVIDSKGHIVTIKRFISDTDIWVETDEGEKLNAKLTGSDSETGIAVMEVEKSLKPARLCNIKKLIPGDFLFVIGNSFGLKNGISINIFSGRRDDNSYLQLGNSVLPGNSGAGVFNTKGELVGIVSFALRTSLSYGAPEISSVIKKEIRIQISPKLEISADTEGPGVIIPCERMLELANEIIVYGKIERGWLGVFLKEEEGKVVVNDIVDNSPAQKAGIKKDDIILDYNKKNIENFRDFVKIVKETKPGATAQITVKRGKKKKKIDVEIGKRPDEEKLYRFREILPPFKLFYEKDELRILREELEKLREELEKKKED
ncbi:MAG: serine protease [Candidatus Cloacimonadota bacterium]|nr:MAG: serine protease [Candidatus Cloacimonadota bacterium]